MRNLIIGGIVCVIGIAVTAGTYSAADTNGGSYTIMYGAIIFGGIQALMGLGQIISGGGQA